VVSFRVLAEVSLCGGRISAELEQEVMGLLDRTMQEPPALVRRYILPPMPMGSKGLDSSPCRNRRDSLPTKHWVNPIGECTYIENLQSPSPTSLGVLLAQGN